MIHLPDIELEAVYLHCNVSLKIENVDSKKFDIDVWISENCLLFNWNNIFKKFVCKHKFDVKDVKNLPICFDTKNSTFNFEIPCMPSENANNIDIIGDRDNNSKPEKTSFDITKMKRITKNLILKVDDVDTPIDFNYSFGFNGYYKEDTSLIKSDLKPICRIKNPSHRSTIERFYKREMDELNDFSEDQYKLNFIELQVPEGHENPMNYTFNFQDTKLIPKEEYTLKTICSKALCEINDNDRTRIDNELVSILLAICYDIRTTAGESNCESGWTRSILSAPLSYFEPIYNLESVIEIFLRRSLIYPLYLNYDLGRLCVEDAIHVMTTAGPAWILKQLLQTYYLFLESKDSRQLLNKYYIEDYIRYVHSIVTKDYLKLLAKNTKNSLTKISKRNLRLGLVEIETDLLKELIYDIHLAKSDDSDDDSSSFNSSDEGEEVNSEVLDEDDESVSANEHSDEENNTLENIDDIRPHANILVGTSNEVN